MQVSLCWSSLVSSSTSFNTVHEYKPTPTLAATPWPLASPGHVNLNFYSVIYFVNFLRFKYFSVPLLLRSMGHVIESLASVCLSVCVCVCRHSYGHNFNSIVIKFCAVVRGLKSKIEFVWGENQMTPSFPSGLLGVVLRPSH